MRERSEVVPGVSVVPGMVVASVARDVEGEGDGVTTGADEVPSLFGV